MKNLLAKWPGKCAYCALGFAAGQKVTWDSTTKKVYHPACVPSSVGIQPLSVTELLSQGEATAKGMPIVGTALTGTAPAGALANILKAHAQKVATSGVVAPKTQKARGIVALIQVGMLKPQMARVATSLGEAREHYLTLQTGKGVFMRPCPIEARHGFVDSRVVTSLHQVQEVWDEARAVDPQAEAVLMPFIDATHNMVWTPGLLSVGPGHDGATGGHDSISIPLVGTINSEWTALAEKAGVKLDSQDPFVEAVDGGTGTGTIVTQIRAGAKGAPTEPDWNPHDGMVVGDVTTIDQKQKQAPGYMLAWEGIAKGLTPGWDVVYNPGGNLADHFSVHARLANVSVVTTFYPVVGQTLRKMGVDLVSLEPQAVVWGYLAGLLVPGLRDNPELRKRGVVAGILGGHHGLNQGGDAGVFLGISAGLLLRLAQAILWGEARHAGHKHISRDQIYKAVLDDWPTGRAGLKEKIGLFYTHKWGGAFGGKAWAGIGQAVVALDTAMLNLVKMPSQLYVKDVVGRLTTAVNTMHNTGWAFNKFLRAHWFDLCAASDPRPALLAAPLWYDTVVWSQTHAPQMLQLLDGIEKMEAIDLSGFKTVAMKTWKGGKKPAMLVGTLQGLGEGGEGSGKIGSFGGVMIGGVIPTPGTVVAAQGKQTKALIVHLQLKLESGGYVSGDVYGVGTDFLAAMGTMAAVPSWSGSGARYRQLTVGPAVTPGLLNIGAGDHVLVQTAVSE